MRIARVRCFKTVTFWSQFPLFLCIELATARENSLGKLISFKLLKVGNCEEEDTEEFCGRKLF